VEREELTGYQASVRGGVVRVSLDGERVRLGGQAVTVLRGELVESKAFQAEWLAEIAGPMLQWLMHTTHTSRIIREIHPSSR
jgi:hypothetical protein